MSCVYETLISDANKLLCTFTIRYCVTNYENDLFSSTYDELNGWVKKALKQIEVTECCGRESELYKHLRRFRGKTGDITLNEFMHLIDELQENH